MGRGIGNKAGPPLALDVGLEPLETDETAGEVACCVTEDELEAVVSVDASVVEDAVRLLLKSAGRSRWTRFESSYLKGIEHTLKIYY